MDRKQFEIDEARVLIRSGQLTKQQVRFISNLFPGRFDIALGGLLKNGPYSFWLDMNGDESCSIMFGYDDENCIEIYRCSTMEEAQERYYLGEQEHTFQEIVFAMTADCDVVARGW